MTKLPAAAAPRSPVPVRTTLNRGASGVYLVTSLTGLMNDTQIPASPESQRDSSLSGTGSPSLKPGSSLAASGPHFLTIRTGSISQTPGMSQ